VTRAVEDLEQATRLAGARGRYRGTIHGSWFIWGPNGGFLSALALRAAAAESRFGRLASYSCQFLGVGREGEVELEVARLREARRAEALRVEMRQAGEPILQALLWLVADDVPGLEHRDLAMPDVPMPDALPSHELLHGPSTTPFFQRLERRPVDVRPAGEPGPPRVRVWLRFRPTARYDDGLVDSLRPLVVSDTLYWPAARSLHVGNDVGFTAPGLDLHARFHDFAPPGEWLLCDTHAFAAGAGLLAADSLVWSADGRLLVSSATQALFRKNR
jgi:acyl-CoA thioesterase